MAERFSSLSRTRISAWMIWATVAIVISTMCIMGRERSVVPSYRFGSESWFAGQPIYDMKGYGFVYLPQAAIVYAPWVFLPKPLGEVVWTCANIGILAYAVSSLTRLLNGDDRWFLINTIVSAAIGMGSIANAQATVIMCGLMMLACVSASKSHWNRAAVLLMLALACKPTCLILVLLVGAIYPPMLLRLAVGMVCFVGAPFLTQSPDYVISQFVAFFQNSQVAYADGQSGSWAHLYGMLRVAGLDVPPRIQQLSRVVAGLAVLGSCWIAVRKLSPARGGFYVYAISTCYLMLFSPRVEGCTYVMIGSVYGCLLADAWLQKKNRAATIGFLTAIVCTVFSFDIALLVTKQPNEVWLNPFICLFVTGYLISMFVRELKSTNAVEEIPTRTTLKAAA